MSKAVLNTQRCSIGCKWRVFLTGVSILWYDTDSSKTVLDTFQLMKIKSREAPKQGITVVKYQPKHLQP